MIALVFNILSADPLLASAAERPEVPEFQCAVDVLMNFATPDGEESQRLRIDPETKKTTRLDEDGNPVEGEGAASADDGGADKGDDEGGSNSVSLDATPMRLCVRGLSYRWRR
ncbi:hypothetical protein GCM10007148_20270 [Parvularcula lutaonensis]|nr:hypothetical protein GCM10007148_20270 [Parvularcula lutaonensis]